MPSPAPYPDAPSTEPELDDLLARPDRGLIEFIRTVRSPLLILGAGGKMGPSLAWLARRAADAAGHALDIIAVSRFTSPDTRTWLEQRGIQTCAADALDPAAVASLPDAPDIIYLLGLKFGTRRKPADTWATNTLGPARVCERFPRARIVALSTGNVYPLTDIRGGGSREEDPLTPLGEYANAAVGRERIFEFFAARNQTPIALLRLYYAIDLRYGVLVDIGRKVAAREPIRLANGYFNCIWQGDANHRILRALGLAAAVPTAWNLCRPEVFSVRETATRFGKLLANEPRFEGVESDSAFLANATQLCRTLGEPPVTADQMIHWIAHWIRAGGRDLGKPTHFEVRDGVY
jgi:hypothetical protein